MYIFYVMLTTPLHLDTCKIINKGVEEVCTKTNCYKCLYFKESFASSLFSVLTQDSATLFCPITLSVILHFNGVDVILF